MTLIPYSDPQPEDGDYLVTMGERDADGNWSNVQQTKVSFFEPSVTDKVNEVAAAQIEAGNVV